MFNVPCWYIMCMFICSTFIMFDHVCWGQSVPEVISFFLFLPPGIENGSGWERKREAFLVEGDWMGKEPFSSSLSWLFIISKQACYSHQD